MRQKVLVLFFNHTLDFPVVKVNHDFFHQCNIDAELLHEIGIIEQFGTQLYLLDSFHEFDDEYFEGVLVLLVAVDVALAALHFCEYLVGMDFEAPIVLDLVHTVPGDFVVDHHLDDPLGVLHDLLQRHVHSDGPQYLGLVVDFLDVL